MTSELSSLYKNKPIILWVEDPLTRTWLHHLWRDADIGLLVAGGNDAVFGVVRDARAFGHTGVFGFRDRDFIASNQPNWLVQAKDPTVFVPEAHEIENLLLDFGGLASLGPNYNRRSRTAKDLEARAHQRAKDGLWWMAARATIADMRLELTNDFPNHPKLGSPALTKAAAQQYLEQHLLHSAWGVRIQSTAQGLGVAWIARHLQQHEAALSTSLSDGSWRWQWSGKELFADVAGAMGCPAPDLAKGLAEHQRTQGTVEPAMVALRSALRKRTGLDRW